jgi:hypothetical protein
VLAALSGGTATGASFSGGGTAEIAGSGNLLTISGNGGSALDTGASNTLTLWGAGDIVTIGTYLGVWGQTVSGDYASLTLSATSGTVNVAGAYDALTLHGGFDVVNVTGTNETLTVSGAGDTVNLSGVVSGTDSVTAPVGGDTFVGGAAMDAFNVVGHASADIFSWYKSVSRSPLGATDTITGFTDTHDHGSFNDVLNFSKVSGLTTLQGGLNNANQKVGAHSIAWFYDAVHNQTLVYANTSGSSVAQSSASLMVVALLGGNFHLSTSPNVNVVV